jgi:hypothetical protein
VLFQSAGASAQRAGTSNQGSSSHSGVHVVGTNGSWSSSSGSSSSSSWPRSTTTSGRRGSGPSGSGGGIGSQFEFAIDVGWLSPNLSDAAFSGQSIRRSTLDFVQLGATGRALGFVQPSLFEAQSHFRFAFGPYLNLGLAAGVFGWGRFDQPAQDTDARAVIGDGSTLWGGSLSASMQFMIPLGFVTLRPGVMAGLRLWNVTAADLASGTCSYTATGGARVSNAPCSDTVGAVTGYVQPRMSVDFDTPEVFGVGAYLGVDVYPAWGIALGVTVSVRTPPFGGGWSETFAPRPPPPPVVVPLEVPPPPEPVAAPPVYAPSGAEVIAPSPEAPSPEPYAPGANTFGGPASR